MAAGSNGTVQTVEATNPGDGTLNLSVKSSVAWIVPTVGPARTCASGATSCIPIFIALTTSTLAKGTYTGFVTVSDPAAVDAPQSISVTVQPGGSVPGKVDFFLPPDGSKSDYTFSSNSTLQFAASADDQRKWLAMSLDGGGTFAFGTSARGPVSRPAKEAAPRAVVALDSGGSFPFTNAYRIRALHLPDMAEGTYKGSVVVSASAISADNKTVPVTLQVTTQPIAQMTVAPVRLVVAQGAPAQTVVAQALNIGQGQLTVSSASAAAGSGGKWLTAGDVSANSFPLTIDPSGLEVGVYQGSVTINSNAANSVLTATYELQIVPPGGPEVTFQGVGADGLGIIADSLAPGGRAFVLGTQLTAQDPATATDAPWATTLNDVQVLVNDRPVPLFSTAYGKIVFQVPFDMPTGVGTLKVLRGDQSSNTISVNINAFVPRIPRNALNAGKVFDAGGNLIGPDNPAHPGDNLTVWAVGLGITKPAVDAGAMPPSEEPLARIFERPLVLLGGNGAVAPLLFEPGVSSLAPGQIGIYQVTFGIPEEVLRAPAVGLTLVQTGAPSNTVTIPIVDR